MNETCTGSSYEYMCLDGMRYGYCSSEYCNGACEALEICPCKGCETEDCCEGTPRTNLRPIPNLLFDEWR